jgi:hypothetical protein
MRILIVAATAALCACSGGQGNKAGNNAAANVPANTATAPSTGAPNTTNTAAASAGVPADGYRRYFDERWEQAGAPVTPAEVAAMLAKQTPQQTVNALYGTGENSRWTTVARGIARGEEAWLALAPQIAKGTDAGTSDEFAMAAQDALTTNPAGTLRLLSQIEMGAGACAENGFEVSAEQASAFHQTAITAVEAVSDPALQKIKTECLAALRKDAAEYPAAAAAQAAQK